MKFKCPDTGTETGRGSVDCTEYSKHCNTQHHLTTTILKIPTQSFSPNFFKNILTMGNSTVE